MAASAFAGTGVVKATASGILTETVDMLLPLNGNFSFIIGNDDRVSVSKSGVTVMGPMTQVVMMQLWQDLAQIGLAG